MGNQFDAFANNVHDGWTCMAVRAADKLGNQQVSRVLRVCVDHDGVGNECPHLGIIAIANATPMTVLTSAPHGLTTGDDIVISRSDAVTANGRWTVTVTGANTFTLDGSQQDNLRPGDGTTGAYVRSSVLPDCTGTQTSLQPVTVTYDPLRPLECLPELRSADDPLSYRPRRSGGRYQTLALRPRVASRRDARIGWLYHDVWVCAGASVSKVMKNSFRYWLRPTRSCPKRPPSTSHI